MMGIGNSINGSALIYDINFFLTPAVPGLTPEIVEQSIYGYLEGVLGMRITTSRKTVKVEHVAHDDKEAIDILDCTMAAMVVGQTFNSDGVMFETTFSRHRPGFFTSHNTAVRGYWPRSLRSALRCRRLYVGIDSRWRRRTWRIVSALQPTRTYRSSSS